jgi:hypothetical protein
MRCSENLRRGEGVDITPEIPVTMTGRRINELTVMIHLSSRMLMLQLVLGWREVEKRATWNVFGGKMSLNLRKLKYSIAIIVEVVEVQYS